MKYSQEQLELMAEKINLADYISKTEDLHRRGDNYFINCPFHKGDDTASLCIYPKDNTWYCFGCGEGGNIYNWIMRRENVRFDKAVDIVKTITGIDIDKIEESKSVKLFKQLRRGFKTETENKRIVLDFQKDYIDKYPAVLPEEWLAEDMTAEALETYNIRIDPNSNRIIYPVFDAEDNFIGVNGRTRVKAYKALGLNKYINYHKIGNLDYFQGWQQAYPEIKACKSVIIFEGVKSCIKAWGWGIKNTVASETARLSDGQLKLLIKNGLSEVIIAWDKDQKPLNILSDSKIQMLKRFTKVTIVRDVNNYLGEKDAPVDKGEKVFKELLKERY